MGDRLAEPVTGGDAGPGASWRPAAATCLCVARAFRDFGDAFVAVLLPVYLAALGYGPLEIGAIATAALLGSALMTLGAGLFGRSGSQRALLIAASALMVATGLAFAGSRDLAWLLAIAFVGTVNPSAGNVSIFVPMEHALLAASAPDAMRTRLFAIYSLLGGLAAAAGSLAAASPGLLVDFGWTHLQALRALFVLYALLGVAGGIAYALIPRDTGAAVTRLRFGLGPSKRVVLKLAGLFSIDAFAGGFIVQSLLALWLFQKFGLSLASAAVFFFWSGLLAALSYPAAAWLSRRFGLLNTMVYTHIPSSVCLIGAALTPDLHMALALLLVRAALSQMDVPTRSSYVMAVVTPGERAAAASVTSVPRGLASAASPVLAGALLAAGRLDWPLLICGVLKIAYDVALLRAFRHVRPPEESARIP